MNRNCFYILLIFILISGCNKIKRSEQTLLTMDYDQLLEAEKAISKNSPLYVSAFRRLTKEADYALNLPLYSVTQKNVLPPSGDKNDYMSLAPYWWPDTSKPDGMPYIRRDGIRNPESEEGRFDRHRLGLMTDDVITLTLAWFFTGEEKYAEKASILLENWFTDPATRVNPNLTYAQSIPGILDGRGIGIIDTRRYIEIIDAITILERSHSWNSRKSKRLQEWFSEYLYWLVNSDHGKDERAKKNNHGTWYDLQIVCYANFTGNHELARKIIRQSGPERIDIQIDSLGRQEFELVRTRSFSYSVFNLEALINLGRMGEMIGEENWGDASHASKVKSACDFLFSYTEKMEDWPYEQITPVEWSRLLPLIKEAGRLFKTNEYNIFVEYLEEKLKPNDRLIITKI